MVKLQVPFLTSRPGANGARRWYFQPPSRFGRDGWAAVRLHDQFGRPITSELEAAAACRELAAVFDHWRNGVAGFGPHRIDKLGRVVDGAGKGKLPRFMPGQVGAMIADYKRSPIFLAKSAKTRAEYSTYLDLFAAKFGDCYWQKLAPGAVRAWLVERAEAGGGAGAHALYRTARAFFGKVRLIYSSVDHPGFVPAHANPLASLDLSLPDAVILPWPREAVAAFVELADREGEPSIGDAVVTMSWLGVRRQDWLSWPADVFDAPLLAFVQEKTAVPAVLPWSLVPELAARVAAAKERRAAASIASTSFFTDRNGRPWASAQQFRRAFNRLRELLAAERPTFPTRFYCGLIEGEPLALPASALTMRTMRHTCVTLQADAGVPPELIRAITGHSQKEFEQVLAHYRARTADQAEAALQLRLAHERGKEAKG